jgi:hypothetical protein
MPTDYEKAHAKYQAMAKAAAGGDADAKRDKAKAMQEIRVIEREAARAGTILSATHRADGSVQQRQETAPTKQSLQEEYCRRFDDKTPVMIDGKKTTLREHHERRLLKRK